MPCRGCSALHEVNPNLKKKKKIKKESVINPCHIHGKVLIQILQLFLECTCFFFTKKQGTPWLRAKFQMLKGLEV